MYLSLLHATPQLWACYGRSGQLKIGDRVIAMNHVEIASADIVGIIKDTDDNVLLTVEGMYA